MGSNLTSTASTAIALEQEKCQGDRSDTERLILARRLKDELAVARLCPMEGPPEAMSVTLASGIIATSWVSEPEAGMTRCQVTTK